jgi:hypothetical protein
VVLLQQQQKKRCSASQATSNKQLACRHVVYAQHHAGPVAASRKLQQKPELNAMQEKHVLMACAPQAQQHYVCQAT